MSSRSRSGSAVVSTSRKKISHYLSESTSVLLAFCISLAVSVLVCTLPVSAQGIQAGEKNLLANPGFEGAEQDGWAAGWQRQAGYSRSQDLPRSGDWCLHYANEDAARYLNCSAPLQLAPDTEYVVEGWVRTTGVVRNRERAGATIAVEAYAVPSGEYLGGSYHYGLAGTRETWTRIALVYRTPKEERVRYTVLCYLAKGVTGSACWDDLAVRRRQPPPIARGVTTDYYRDQVPGGPLSVRVGLDLAAHGLEPEGVAATLTVTNQGGEPVLTRAKPVRLEPSYAEFRFDATSLELGRYALNTAIRRRDTGARAHINGQVDIVPRLPERRVHIDRHQRLIVEGRPFFPLGLYANAEQATLERMAAAGFNCLLDYNSVLTHDRATLDLVERNGLKLIYSLKDCYADQRWTPEEIRTEADERPFIAAKVAEFRDHPALLGWYLNDEQPVAMLERLQSHYTWVKELDPHHPTWSVFHDCDPAFVSSSDVVGYDWYPLAHRPPQAIGSVLAAARRARAGVLALKPLWFVLQIHNEGVYRQPRQGYRAPTAGEIRAMAWQAVAAGANGLIFYRYDDLMKAATAGLESFEEQWGRVRAAASELSALIPVLLSIESTTATLQHVEVPAAVAWRCWVKDGHLWLLVVNSAGEPMDAAFELGLDPAEARVETGVATVRTVARSLQVRLPPLEAVMLRIRPR